jgi:hypothetical protein
MCPIRTVRDAKAIEEHRVLVASTPRCCSVMCTWVKAIENARAAALPSRYFRAEHQRGVAIRRHAGGEGDAQHGSGPAA